MALARVLSQVVLGRAPEFFMSGFGLQSAPSPSSRGVQTKLPPQKLKKLYAVFFKKNLVQKVPGIFWGHSGSLPPDCKRPSNPPQCGGVPPMGGCPPPPTRAQRLIGAGHHPSLWLPGDTLCSQPSGTGGCAHRDPERVCAPLQEPEQPGGRG